VVFDGATGTELQKRHLTAADYGGVEYEGCPEYLTVTRPDIIGQLHEAYLAAGADVVETNTFGVMPIVLADYGLAARARELAAMAARLARTAADKYSTPEHPRFVAGALGPGTKSLSVTGGATYAAIREAYAEAIRGLLDGDADCLLFETVQDGLNLKAAFDAADLVFAETGRTLPIGVSCTIETSGTTLAGQDIEAFYVSIMHRPLLLIGLNCATGPAFMTDHLRTLAAVSRFPVSCQPNAGLPDENGHYPETPEMLAAKISEFAEAGRLNFVGGCCGTTPAHIQAIVETVRSFSPRRPPTVRRAAVSGLETVEIYDGNRPVLVGERTNSLGSKKFRDLIAEGKYDEAAEVGRAQVRAGAQIIDLCLQNPDRDEADDVIRFLRAISGKVRAPLMLDTTDLNVLEEALTRCQGKVIFNSVNLEEGEARLARVAELARRYGMALVVGCIDEDAKQAQAISRERKVSVAARCYALLTEKFGVPPEDLIFDPLVFPCGTGDAAYRGSARETIEGVRLIKERFPRCKTLLGVSNVSFGLPPGGRETLNSVFLCLCVDAGLDLPIVNSQKLIRRPLIPEVDWKICLDLIDSIGPDPVAAFAAHFRGRKNAVPAIVGGRRSLPLAERLAGAVVEGGREGLIEDLEELRKTTRPLEIINGPLMKGMDEVGRLFAQNQLIVAEVLQSAEVMKAAVAHLEPFMQQDEIASRGTLLLATVKGDVHDIGKSLVEIILSNNGFRVIDLGIKTAPERIIQAARECKPDMIGLSGLLVKSAQQMVATAADLKSAGIAVPLLVGGAALSNRFTRTRIAPVYGGPVLYARDAMDGLDLAQSLMDAGKRETLLASLKEAPLNLVATTAAEPLAVAAEAPPATPKREFIQHDFSAPVPPDFEFHTIKDWKAAEVYPYVNPVMLFCKHLGLRGNPERLWKTGVKRALDLRRTVEKVLAEAESGDLLRPRGVYRFYVAASEGDALTLYDNPAAVAQNRATARFIFPRQSVGEKLCLSDLVRPRTQGADYLAAFVVSCGHGIREKAAELRQAGRLLDAHTLQALALECTEATAERLHEQLRHIWGFPDEPQTTKHDLLRVKYRGVRMSFGYPACPRIEDQKKLFEILSPEKYIGVSLTEGYMMDPEASVSALAFHHPQGKYFQINEEDLERFEKKMGRMLQNPEE
jgi:5-methyltetrahydrofolate--homocysteine methyltransferase